MRAVGRKPFGVSPWVAALLGVAGLALFLAGLLVALGLAGANQWRRYAATLREGGTPLTMEEIERARAVVPEERNGAKVIEALFAELEATRLPSGDERHRAVLVFGAIAEHFDLLTGIPKYAVEPSRTFLEEHRKTFNHLGELRQYSIGRFVIDHQELPYSTLLPHLSPVRQAGKLLHLAAVLALVDDDLAAARDAVILQFRLARTLHDEPILASRFVQIRVTDLAIDGLELILASAEPDHQSLEAIRVEVEDRLKSDTLRWALLGERALFVGVCEELAAGNTTWRDLQAISSQTGPPVASALGIPAFLVRRNQIRGTAMYTWLIDAAEESDALSKAASRVNAEARNLPSTQLIAKVFVRDCHSTVGSHFRTIARLHCARVALAAERFRLSVGRLPETPDELIPGFLDAIPDDPFDDNPLRWAPTAEGVVIYSIGENRSDEGGKVAENAADRRPLGVGFRLLHPEHRGLKLLNIELPTND